MIKNENIVENTQNPKEKTKLGYINSLEVQRENNREPNQREKYFITFPYPYMNGKLHLGHLFSISKSDFMSYYKEQQGYNVLFPLSFHCTGMPISASAKKLKEELDGKETDISTKSIIEGLGFEDVKPFTDPVHWIKTFPKYCKASLEHFAANIDWRRSFITTDINKYYDSFIRWQFLKLRELGHLSFGKRYSIYCPVDEQPCLDHDRRKGENIKPVQTLMCKLKTESGFVLSKYKPFVVPNKIVLSKNIQLVHCKVEDVSYYMEKEYFDNLKYQVTGLEKISTVQAVDILVDCKFDNQTISVEFVEKDLFVVKGKEEQTQSKKYEKEIKAIKDLEENKDCKMMETINFVSIYVPEDEVISRSGGKCVVSLMDQWFVDYSDLEWKTKVKKCIGKMICDSDTRSKLLDGVDWIYKWGFSRSFGLGTRIPWDNQYLIDSLSDSTIYMAMYTFKHFMYKDIEGQEEIFPSNKLENGVWEYIFYGKPLPESLKEYEDILIKCRDSFKYFYPVDLRVSGKDLIKNHLLFFIFNHVALFDEQYWPKRIYTNGHLMLNSEKMSKSTGNFLTVDSCLDKYGVSSTRMCLAVCGDTNEDANFIEANANSFILKIYTFVKSIEELVSKLGEEALSKINIEENDRKFIDRYLLEYLSLCIEESINGYEKMKYSDVVKYAFFELTHLKETYTILNGDNNLLLYVVYKTMSQLLYPIMPTLCRHLLTKYFDSDFSLPKSYTTSRTHFEAIEHLKTVSKRIVTNKLKKNNKNVDILVGDSWAPWKVECMKYIDSLEIERNEALKDNKPLISQILSNTKEILLKYKIPLKKGNLFVMDYLYTPSNYDIKLDELEILSKFGFYIRDNTGLNIKVVKDDQGEPLNPAFKFY
ncbi:putative leucine--tRNA ligase, cytoplasmic [Nosema granulosis]|uniref:leucine--tRNA ligase n=1 Tax=Nosema granulosis TaxID=83296 RepID=A0A9P6KYT1_9MICR|nr:putative leucine--tRNA ligase, cytoplasmic [Nosema granulosis]